MDAACYCLDIGDPCHCECVTFGPDDQTCTTCLGNDLRMRVSPSSRAVPLDAEPRPWGGRAVSRDVLIHRAGGGGGG